MIMVWTGRPSPSAAESESALKAKIQDPKDCLILYIFKSSMGLDSRGIVSVVQIIVYVPLLALAAILVLRHGFSRESGWIFLAIFSLSTSRLPGFIYSQKLTFFCVP